MNFAHRHPLPAKRRWIDAVLPQNALDRAAPNHVAEIVQGTLHPGISPRFVLAHHPEDQLCDFVGFARSSGSAPLAPIVLFRHQLAIPTQDGIGRGDRGYLGQEFPAQEMAKDCQSASVSVREVQLVIGEPVLEDLILPLEVVDLL